LRAIFDGAVAGKRDRIERMAKLYIWGFAVIMAAI
jgi:hypothetical protein